MAKRREVWGVTARGVRVGESHQRAKIKDWQVDYIREIYEEGFVGYRALAAMCWWLWGLRVTRNTIKDICQYKRRATTPDEYRSRWVE